MDQAKIDQILDLLPKCPKTAEVLPCSVKDFRKLIPLLDDAILNKVYEAVALESKLTSEQ